ncbi:hypothetical protein KKF91_20830 [Myxococcota bacterium]|nr:hypothetical protein [Myxococcota bacterium]MBU1432992.1 hypothetical protein [Myxococcota bacterium]MBU1897767.1 hypothetical protein [Myxococcota bacterium]
MRRLTLLTLLLISARAHAQSGAGEQAANEALNDAFLILFNGPVYLSSRLPMLMASQPPVAGMDLKKSGQFSLGISLKSDIYGQFKDVSYGTEFLKLEDATPNTVPLPSLGIYGRFAINKKLDIGARIDFIPTMTHSFDLMEIEAGHMLFGGNARYRVMRAKKSRPEVILSAGGAYSSGALALAAGKKERFSQDMGIGAVGGEYEFTAGPTLEWSLMQLQLEARGRWRMSWFSPYIGFGMDFTSGTISSKLDGALNIQVDEFNGSKMPPELTTRTDNDLNATLAEESPTAVALHPLLGMEFGAQRLKFTIQGDVMMPFAQAATQQKPEVEEFLGDDEGFYYVRYRDNTSGFRNPVFSLAMGLRYDFN